MNSRLCALLIAALLWMDGELQATDAPPLYSITIPATEIHSGSVVTLQLAVLNRSVAAITVELPPSLECEIVGHGRRWTVSAESAGATTAVNRTVRPAGYILRNYVFRLPVEVPEGGAMLELHLSGVGPLRTGLRVDGELPIASTPPVERTRRPTTNLARAEPAAAALRRTFADRLAPHEPLYFIAGSDAPAAKFQFSFKYKVLDFKDVAPRRMGRTLQFAFTQRSLWDIKGESSPFYDTSYMPELIFESLAPKPEQSDRWFTWLGFQTAFKHESNGRDGPMSRSLNMVYARPVFAFGQLDGWHLLVIPEVFGYVSSLDNNPDLEDYRGYGALRLVLGENDGPSLMTTLWSGKNFDHWSAQFDLTLPIRTKLLNFETYLLVQYFDGYGESLLSYREKSDTVRAGISLVR